MSSINLFTSVIPELERGQLIALPTETVYGLGADATNPLAVAKIFEAKGRPRFNPLIAHIHALDAAQRLGVFTSQALRLATHFWPGPLTLVVPKTQDCPVCDLALAGLATIGLRIPHHPLALELLKAFGKPVVAPSANRSGHVSPTTAQHVRDDLGDRVAAILDGGPCPVGVESTIVACLPDEPVRLLRPGGVTREAIEAVLGEHLAMPTVSASPLAPGMLASHYAPKARVRLEATSIEPGEAALLFGSSPMAHMDATVQVLNLSTRGDLVEAAANLFGFMRRLDQEGVNGIAVAPIPFEGLGEAINDRLTRAAAPRPVS